MADYQSFLAVSVLHDYYNANSNGLAPVDLIPDRDTAWLLRQYSILLKSARGFTQLVVDTEQFADLADLTDELALRFYLVSTDPVTRSITQMPNMFDISTIKAAFIDSATLDISAEQWVDIDQLNATTAYEGVATYNKNLISILTVSLPKHHLTLEKKSITVRFNAISTCWKYYIFSLSGTKKLTISDAFTEQEHEQIANKTARVFLSNDQIPLRQVYTEPFSLSDDKNVIIKSLPLPTPDNISIFIAKEIKKSITHIYVN
ncbi:hypothetical protein J5069_04495 [Candidatus Symbiopectobacterium sp. NZEC127]|uniref:hypothetical protein n=1 Tax=Candidatus Symbiopectobacterium sp. NZEC127 TaxID=2820472 RepID=UPI002225E7D2|nr:hypothetical protein [Candidatus Symbiopectobacterium sp. NZEC127]MCW2485153.1 hypothetical protein [Candidatus Symbiopectobacterium sp. NZEC127]